VSLQGTVAHTQQASELAGTPGTFQVCGATKAFKVLGLYMLQQLLRQQLFASTAGTTTMSASGAGADCTCAPRPGQTQLGPPRHLHRTAHPGAVRPSPCLSGMSCSARERSVHSMSRIACRPSSRTGRTLQRGRWHCHDSATGLSAPAVPPCSLRGGNARLCAACRAPSPARPGAAEPVPAG